MLFIPFMGPFLAPAFFIAAVVPLLSTPPNIPVACIFFLMGLL